MRTTLTLDDDVAAKLKSESRKSGKSFRETVNDFLRIGLNSNKQTKPGKKFRVKTRNLYPREGLNFDNIGELLEQVEGPSHK
ncbi:DUF2191 domain-containing protein [bacterium]|nr:DUF2191 domain-containing protein [bacterium]